MPVSDKASLKMPAQCVSRLFGCSMGVFLGNAGQTIDIIVQRRGVFTVEYYRRAFYFAFLENTVLLLDHPVVK